MANRRRVPDADSDPVVAKLGDLLTEMQEQTKWLRFLGLRALGPLLEQELKNDREKVAYELSDGRPSTVIASAVGVSGQSVRNWWARWSAAGIAIERDGGRVVHLASLAQLGTSVPSLPKTTGEPSASTEEAP